MICSCAPSYTIGTCMPNMRTFKARVGCGQGGQDIAYSLAMSNHLQQLLVFLVDVWDNINPTSINGMFLRGDPRLVVAGTDYGLLKELQLKLKEIGVGYKHLNLLESMTLSHAYISD